MQANDTLPPLDGRRSVTREPRTCHHCGTEFVPKRQTRGMFCSRRCYWDWWAQHRAEEVSKQGNARLDELRAAGHDPRATRQAAWKRKMAFRQTALELFEDAADGEAWTERGRYWEGRLDDDRPADDLYRRRERKPLVLAGHGAKLRVHGRTLLATHGFTYYPQEAREERFFKGDPRLPSRIVLVATDGFVSMDAVRWLAEQRVPLVLLDYQGRVESIIARETTAADLDLRRAQIAALDDGRGFAIAKSLIERKLEGSLTTLGTLPPSSAQESAIDRVATLLHELQSDPPADVDALRLLEAHAAHAYFKSWRSLPIHWKGTGRKPIPPAWRHIGLRGDFFAGGNRNAHHPFNAVLNYGYGVLESRVRIAVAETGLDPTIGYLHVNTSGRAALVYDFMEPFRPRVDREVLGFIWSNAFTPRDFVIDSRGVCRLHPELAKTFVHHLSDVYPDSLVRTDAAVWFRTKDSADDLPRRKA